MTMTTRLLSIESLSAETATRLEELGVKLSGGGAHSSRTMMLKEITRLVFSVPSEGSHDDYRAAVVRENVLGKATEAGRQKSFRYLRELYGLSPKIPLFAAYRRLIDYDRQSAPLLSFLAAWARDPLFRASTPAVLPVYPGREVGADDLRRALDDALDGQYGDSVLAKIARNAASSWTQSGHLAGHVKKLRQRVAPRPAALTLALWLGALSGSAGEAMLSSVWCRLLDLSTTDARALAAQAHREALITLRTVGSVVDISFSGLAMVKGVSA